MLLIKKYKVFGHSMEPFLKNEDICLISSVPYLFKNPKINDIVLFIYKDKKYLKRVTKISEQGYFLKGDNNTDSFDSKNFGLIKRDKIIGKVIFKI